MLSSVLYFYNQSVFYDDVTKKTKNVNRMILFNLYISLDLTYSLSIFTILNLNFLLSNVNQSNDIFRFIFSTPRIWGPLSRVWLSCD